MAADRAGEASEPWWIIGSAAVALHGAPVINVRDVDLMMGQNDARRFLASVGVAPEPASDHPRFRSMVLGIWGEPPLPVEVFGDFSLATSNGWRPVRLHSREPVTVGGRSVFVPSAGELEALLLSFGRAKDLERARLLRRG